LNKWLSRILDEELAYYILYVPMFCAVFVIWPVRNLYVRVAMRRFCKSAGHDLEIFKTKDGTQCAMCRRCYAYLAGQKP